MNILKFVITLTLIAAILVNITCEGYPSPMALRQEDALRPPASKGARVPLFLFDNDSTKASSSGEDRTDSLGLPHVGTTSEFNAMLQRAHILGINLPILTAEAENLLTGRKEEITIGTYVQSLHYEPLGGYGSKTPFQEIRNTGINMQDGLLLVAESAYGVEGIVYFRLCEHKNAIGLIYGTSDIIKPRQLLSIGGLAVKDDNVFGFTNKRLKGVGSLLMAAVIRASLESEAVDEDQKGNVIVTGVSPTSWSIHDPHGFYEAMGMTPLGENNYCFTQEQAKRFLQDSIVKYNIKPSSTFTKAPKVGLHTLDVFQQLDSAA